MIKRAISILLLTLPIALQTKGQAKIVLEKIEHDFGSVYEDSRLLVHSFPIKNTGNKPLEIYDIKANCECTEIIWQSEPISPGEKSNIVVEYNPKGKIGEFKETMLILSNAKNAKMFITIKGEILPVKEKSDLKHEIGKLTIQSKHINFGYMFKGDIATKIMPVANFSDKKIRLGIDKNLPKYLDIIIEPEELYPQQHGRIITHYNTNKVNDWGHVIDKIDLKINGYKKKDNQLTITSNIREDFSNITAEQLVYAPKAKIADSIFVYDTITNDTPIPCEFEMINQGKTDLLIRAIKPSCGCTVVHPEKKSIKPNEKVTIKVIFYPKGRTGKFKKAVTFITNDPVNYKQYMWVQGYIDR